MMTTPLTTSTPATGCSAASGIGTAGGLPAVGYNSLLRGPHMVPRRLCQHDTDDLYEPLDVGTGSPPELSRRRRCRFLSTQSRSFNFVVGLVIVANAAIIGLEADLGLLGNSSPKWDGLRADMDLFGMRQEEAPLRDSVLKGLAVDSALKDTFHKEVADRFHQNAHLRDDLIIGTGSTGLRSGAYTVCELFFVFFFTTELLLRLCDSRMGDGNVLGPCSDRWNHFDAVLVILGICDVALPLVLAGPEASSVAASTLAFLRTSRVLRVFRLFRVCSGLRSLGWGVLTAFSTVLWIGVVILILNFVTASVLTSCMGQKSDLWGDDSEQIELWFGSMGRSMQTLLGIMTLSGFSHIALVVSEVVPSTVVNMFIAVYIMFCFFTMLSLVSSLINVSFMAAMKQDDEERFHAVEEYRGKFAVALTNVFMASDQQSRGYLSRDEFRGALESHPNVLTQMKKLDMETNFDELLQLFDRLVQDSGCVGGVKIDSLVDAMVHINRTASSADVFDARYMIAALRRETASQLGALRHEASSNHQESLAQTAGQIAGLRKLVETVLETVKAAQKHTHKVSADMVALEAKVDGMQRVVQLEAQESANHRALVGQRLEQLASKASAIATTEEKLEALAEQSKARDAALGERLEGLAGDLEKMVASRLATLAVVAAASAAPEAGALEAAGSASVGKILNFPPPEDAAVVPESGAASIGGGPPDDEVGDGSSTAAGSVADFSPDAAAPSPSSADFSSPCRVGGTGSGGEVDFSPPNAATPSQTFAGFGSPVPEGSDGDKGSPSMSVEPAGSPPAEVEVTEPPQQVVLQPVEEQGQEDFADFDSAQQQAEKPEELREASPETTIDPADAWAAELDRAARRG
mmetsp:Transcript_112762/g.324067  ORF Transcript_112762/g.324067 Transcript_112762/m.324067 type:complete len:864 (-) Transcript_112762:171-2762(-)